MTIFLVFAVGRPAGTLRSVGAGELSMSVAIDQSHGPANMVFRTGCPLAVRGVFDITIHQQSDRRIRQRIAGINRYSLLSPPDYSHLKPVDYSRLPKPDYREPLYDINYSPDSVDAEPC